MIKLLFIESNYYPEDLTVSRKLTPGNWYMGNLTPTMYDIHTYNPVDPHYIIVCDDGNLRKVEAKYFITIEDWRNEQIGKILR